MKMARLLGRLSNGCESDKGMLVHIVVNDTALCGKKPGPRSVGWSSREENEAVTCVKCSSKFTKNSFQVDKE